MENLEWQIARWGAHSPYDDDVWSTCFDPINYWYHGFATSQEHLMQLLPWMMVSGYGGRGRRRGDKRMLRTLMQQQQQMYAGMGGLGGGGCGVRRMGGVPAMGGLGGAGRGLDPGGAMMGSPYGFIRNPWGM